MDERGYALVIGVDDYRNDLPALHNARADAEAVAHQLTQDPHGFSVTLLCDAEATRASVKKFFTEIIPDDVADDASIVVYFAGHGVASDDDGTKGPQGFLLLHDAARDDGSTWLDMTELRDQLGERVSACRHVLVVLDCCHAGAFRWASATRDARVVQRPLYQSQYERFLSTPAWQALTSASVDERAADAGGFADRRGTDAQGHSPFAAALIEGLAGGADASDSDFEADGVITATELYLYIARRLTRANGSGVTQTPGIWPLDPGKAGEFVFLNPRRPLETRPDPVLDDTNNPWLGLDAYSAANAPLFFGRAVATEELLARVTAPSPSGALVAVVGASGTGKSSVLQAGLVPMLTNPPGERRAEFGEWAVVQCGRLSSNPEARLDEACRALDGEASGPVRRLLVVDQFEDLYTQEPVEEERQRFEAERERFLTKLRELIDAAGGPTVVVTVRSDVEARAASGPLQDLWPAARWPVPPFTSEELRLVIEGPAHVKALYFDPPELVDALFDEVNAMPGALPLLSFALANLYRQAQVRRRQTGALDRGLLQVDLDAIGGVTGSLNRAATALYRAADEVEQAMIRRIFLRLVTRDGSGLTRRRAHVDELRFGGDDDQRRLVDAVLARYVDAGLLVVDGEHVEPAHSALVREWGELHQWLRESRAHELIRSAWYAASEWAAHDGKKKASSLLWNNDPRLPQLSACRAEGELNVLEVEFQTASAKRRVVRRNRLVAVTLTVIAVLLTAALVANQQRITAEAEARRNLAQLLAVSSTAQGPLGRELALLLAAQAHATNASPVTRAALYQALAREARVTGRFDPALAAGDGAIEGYTLSPDGSLAAVARVANGLEGSRVTFVDVARHLEVIGSVLVGGSPNVVFAAEARRAFVSSIEMGGSLNVASDGSVFGTGSTRISRVDIPAEPATLELGKPTWFTSAGHLAVTPDGRFGVRTDGGPTVRLVDFGEPGAPRGLSRIGTGSAAAPAISPDGTLVAVGAGARVKVLALPTLQPLAVYEPALEEAITALAFSPDGARIAIARGGTLEVLDRATGDAESVGWFRSDRGRPDLVAFSDDGSVVAASGIDTVVVPLADVSRRRVINGRFGGFDSGGRRVVTSGPAGSTRVWSTAERAAGGVPFDVLAADAGVASNGSTSDARFGTTAGGPIEQIVTAGSRLTTWDPDRGPPLLQDVVPAPSLVVTGLVNRGRTIVGTARSVDGSTAAAAVDTPDRDAGAAGIDGARSNGSTRPFVWSVTGPVRPPSTGDTVVIDSPASGADTKAAAWLVEPDASAPFARIELPRPEFTSLALRAVSPDRTLIATLEKATASITAGDEERTKRLVVYDLSSSPATVVPVEPLPPGAEVTVAFAADSRTLFVADRRRVEAVSVRGAVGDARTAFELGQDVTALALAPDGALAYGTADGEVRVISADELASLLRARPAVVDRELPGVAQPGHEAAVAGIWFDPTGSRLVSQDLGGSLHVVDRASQMRLLELANTALGQGIVVTTDDLYVPNPEAVERWDLTAATLEDRACAAADRSLTPAEQRQFLGTSPGAHLRCV